MGCLIQPPKIPASTDDSGVLPHLIAVLSLHFELKQNLEVQPYTKMNC